ncbi:hypothetical protein [Citricoccus nitrophenolicus]|uniref:hypothetical protein n=1 Tax=Citricoccus nitrophenolicus TaxID=863575 RepID=UPI0031F0B8CE
MRASIGADLLDGGDLAASLQDTVQEPSMDAAGHAVHAGRTQEPARRTGITDQPHR